MSAGPFNLRVYALIIRDGRILLSTESHREHRFTKFPGGGLEPGEGLADALKRELQEELGTDARVEELFYVNDFLQPSAFNPAQQIIAFYYIVSTESEPDLSPKTEMRWDKEYLATFHWETIHELQEEALTFPIDKRVLNKLKTDQRST